MTYVQLFFSFLLVGLFSVGGGYAAIPLIQAQVVEAHGWLSMAEFTNLVTIAEMTPGPIAVNSATFVGIRIAGVPGAVVATLGCIFPALILVSVLAYLYRRYQSAPALDSVLSCLRPAVVALIAAAGLAIQNLLGLVCDPIAGLVEAPCQARNAAGASNALVSAELVLAGVPEVIPFDEVVEAAREVGHALPESLRETALGGIAATPTARRLAEKTGGAPPLPLGPPCAALRPALARCGAPPNKREIVNGL